MFCVAAMHWNIHQLQPSNNVSKELILQGYIIKSQDIGEHDVLLTFFSLEHGKLRVIVKSAKKLTSRLAGRLQAAAKIEITLAGNHSLPKLIGASVQESFHDIVQSQDRIAVVMVLQEYTNRALADLQPNEQLFENYSQALRQLAVADTSECLRIATLFIVQTLQAIGVAPRLLQQEYTGAKLWLNFDDGSFIVNSGTGQQSEVTLKVYELFVNLYQAGDRETYDDVVWQKLLKLLNDFSGYQLERQLRAAEYFLS